MNSEVLVLGMVTHLQTPGAKGPGSYAKNLALLQLLQLNNWKSVFSDLPGGDPSGCSRNLLEEKS